MGVWALTHSSIQPLGQLQMGAIAAALSAPLDVFIGAGALLGICLFLAVPNRRMRDVGKVVEMNTEPSRDYAGASAKSGTKTP